MGSKRFLMEGNLCGDRVRLGRAMQKPPMRQEDLAREINLMGMEITPLIISRIEKAAPDAALPVYLHCKIRRNGI